MELEKKRKSNGKRKASTLSQRRSADVEQVKALFTLEISLVARRLEAEAAMIYVAKPDALQQIRVIFRDAFDRLGGISPAAHTVCPDGWGECGNRCCPPLWPGPYPERPADH